LISYFICIVYDLRKELLAKGKTAKRLNKGEKYIHDDQDESIFVSKNQNAKGINF
jgi:hypothetical protein